MKKLLSTVSVLGLITGLMFFSVPVYAASITTMAYTPSGATVGTAVAASSTVATFTPVTAITAGTDIVLSLPTGTTLANIVASDFTIEQGASGTSGAGSATAPTGIAFDDGADTITLTVDAASLSAEGDSDGLGVITIKTSGTAGGNEIIHPTTATSSGTFSVATASDNGSISTVTFIAATLHHLAVVAPATILTGQNMSTTITAQDQYNNTTTVGIAGTVVLTADGGSTVYPASIAQAQFTDDGVWTGNLLLDKAGTITLTATRDAFNGTDSITVTENKIADLTCSPSGQAGAIWLRWTEPAQTYAGLFTGYVVKHYSAALTDVNFGSGTTITQTWSPASAQAGAVQQLVTGLNPSTRYYFGITLGDGDTDTIESLVSDPSPSCFAPASASGNIDTVAPNTQITTPATGSTVQSGQALKITGTAIDTGGSSVQKIEVSLNGGSTWNAATVTSDDGANLIWEYTWANAQAGSVTIKARATDWVGNIETTPAEITVTVSSTATPTTPTTPTGTVAALQTQLQALRVQLLNLLVQLVAKLQAQLSSM
jgi:hypothetical protein